MSTNIQDFTIEQIVEIINGKSNRKLLTIWRKYDSDGVPFDLSKELENKVYIETKTKVYIVNHLEVESGEATEIWRCFKALYIFAALCQFSCNMLREESVRISIIPRKGIIKMNHAGTVVFSTTAYADFQELPLYMTKSRLEKCKSRKEIKQAGFEFAKGLFRLLPITSIIQRAIEAKDDENGKAA